MTTHFGAWDEAKKSDLAARYGGFRCADCIYWYTESWRVEKAVLNDEDINDHTPRAQCRRKAPIPQPFITVITGQLAGSIAWATEAAANIPHTKSGAGADYHVEGADVYEIDEWPMTKVDDWCGEGRSGRKPMSAETIAKFETLEAKVFPPDEEDDKAQGEADP